MKKYAEPQETPPDFASEPSIPYGGYTYADYLNFEFEEMVEIIKGRIFKMSPAPKTAHQQISMNFSRTVSNFLIGKTCQVFHAPFDVILPIKDKKRERATTVVQPDITLICDPAMIEENGCFGVPDWIIEILSPHTSKKDLQLKFDVYEEAGVGEYWIVMPEQQLVEVFHLDNGSYKRINTYVKEDIVFSKTLQGFSISLSDIFPA